MKQTLKLSMLLAICVMLSFAENRRDKEKIEANFLIGQKTSAPDQVNAPSSPWLPLNLENGTSQYRLVDYMGGAIWFSGGKTTAPLLGNYYGYRSKDSGKTWIKYSMPVRQSSATSTSLRYSRVAPANDTVAILGDYYGYIMRTQNGGQKWDTVGQKPYGAGGFYNDIKFVTSSIAVAMGDKIDSTVFFNRSTDGGLTWARVNVPNDSGSKLYDYGNGGTGIIASNGNNVWISAYDADGVVNHPVIYRSTDAGATWTYTKVTSLEASKRWFIRNMSFSSATLGYAVSGGTGHVGRLHKTTDGGTTWSDTINIEVGVDRLQQQVIGVHTIPGSNHVVAVGFSSTTGSKSWLSTDAGATWTVMNTPGNTTTNLNSAVFLSPTLGFTVGTRNVLNYKPSVEVTFVVNSSTVPDTLKTNSTVQMRGDPGASGGVLDWNGNSSVRFANIGGDYWQARVRFAPGTDFPYKLYTHAQANVGGGHPGEHNGWENDINSHGNGNRRMIVGQNDTTIALQFVNGSNAQQPQFWRPYTETDSLEVTFRVNMANQEDFNPTTQKVGVNGSFNGWGSPTFFLKRETNHGNGGSVAYNGENFWSGTFKLPLKKANTDTIGTAGIEYAYKFVQVDANTKWESISDRKFTNKRGSQDTTLAWKWWDDVGVKPPAGSDTAIVQFRVDMTRAIQTNGYTVGDTVQVRYGFANSAEAVYTRNLVKQGLTNIYAATDSSIKKVKIQADGLGKPLVYQYYIVKGGQDFREVYYNFGYNGTDQTLAERRLLPLKTKSNTALDTSKDQTKANRWPFFRNTRKLARVVDVKFTVNLQPAYWQVAKGDTLFDIQGPWNVVKAESVYTWGVSVNGPATGGWASWGTALYNDVTRRMYDNGTNGDAVAGDRIYTRHYTFGPDSVSNGRDRVGQEFKFGIHGGDNEGGKGGFGNNHIENINDAAATATIHSQFGSINPLYYNAWDFPGEKRATSVPANELIPVEYSLAQNYPNPFNPSTTINYSIPTDGIVSLKIFNVLGQEVATLVNEVQTAGNYKASFNAASLSSGVYFYKIEAGSFTSVKKMMLLK